MYTKTNFIKEAEEKYGKFYDYSKVDYKNNKTKVCIICPIHGEFWVTPSQFLRYTYGCPECAKEKLKLKAKNQNKQKFHEKARKIHGNKYDYSKVEYINNHTKVCIICPFHGEFWQTPGNHLKGSGCPICGKQKMISSLKGMTTEKFILKLKEVYDDEYDYSKVDYKNIKTKVILICPIHGEFSMLPKSLLKGCKCPKCKPKSIYSQEEIIEKFKQIHGDKYDYSKVAYNTLDTKVCIICSIHGEFWQTPSKHLQGQGCMKCGYIKSRIFNTSSTEEFIEKARKVHGNKYDYSKVVYEHNAKKVCIICPIHGEFWQSPNNHLHGDRCPMCGISKLEEEIMNFLNENQIEYIWQASKKDLNWCGKQKMDFYLPKEQIIIECQGIQHFRPLELFGGETAFKKQVENDIKKFNLATKNNIQILYYTNQDVDIEFAIYKYNNFYTDKEKLIKKILLNGLY